MVLWSEMTPTELDAAIKHLPLAIVPCGAIEWHGEQLATGCDKVRAEVICTKVAKQLGGGVVLPAMYMAAPGYVNWRGSLFFTPALVKQVAQELYRELEKCGFRYVLMFLGHGGDMQIESFTEPAEAFMRTSKMKILVTMGLLEDQSSGPGEGHAQGAETAELLASAPNLVHLERYDPETTQIPKYGGCDPGLYCTGLSEHQHRDVRQFMAQEHFSWQADLIEQVTPKSAERHLKAVCDNMVRIVQKFTAIKE